MPQLLYIHGFLSSPESRKAKQMGQWLAVNYPHVEFYCPQLTPYPDQCAEVLTGIVEPALERGEPVYLMGSSMGGFWATYLAERYDLPAVLINPAVNVLALMPPYLEQTLHNYHTPDTYYLKTDDLAQLSRYDTPHIHRHRNYWLLVQQGDETLDYQLAIAKYQRCQQTVEDGGDHSFQGFDRFHPKAITFFEGFYSTKN